MITMHTQKFPPGWDEKRVKEVIAHYERWVVLGSGLFTIGSLAGCFLFLTPHAQEFWTLRNKLKVWTWIMSGPFQQLWLGQGSGPSLEFFLFGLVILACIMAHPIWPHGVIGYITACITMMGLVAWFLVGLVLTSVGV